MDQKRVYLLKIDHGFKNLIRPLQHKEYLQLEQNIIHDGCNDPIKTWHGTIIDGHNRYEICIKHKIPFYVTELEFECREEVIAWICAQQLGRRNITEETRRFLIGMQYESEKLVSAMKNPNGINQFSNDASMLASKSQGGSGHVTAQRIADENHISYNTVQKYAMYTRALEAIGKKVPEIVPKILSGRLKLSHKSVMELSQFSPEQIRKICNRLELNQQPMVRFSKAREEISQSLQADESQVADSMHSVKDMPTFDPDAEITGLTLTIPSWASSIQRTRKNADLTITSEEARKKLHDNLEELRAEIEAMLSIIKEE